MKWILIIIYAPIAIPAAILSHVTKLLFYSKGAAKEAREFWEKWFA